MSLPLVDQQLDRIEPQFTALSVALRDGSVQSLQASAERLQQLAVELRQLVDTLPRAGVLQPRRAARLKALAAKLPMLRENLLRRSAYVNRALETLVPTPPKSTYAGRATYGNVARQSGEFKTVSA